MAVTRKLGEGGRSRFTGSGATTGNSRGFRIESAFFKAAPEFGVARSVRLDLIGPGRALLSVDVPAPEAAGDPLVGAWLAFVAQDVTANPDRLAGFPEPALSALETLVAGVTVNNDEAIPDDVTF
jgi:hypothetical protein